MDKRIQFINVGTLFFFAFIFFSFLVDINLFKQLDFNTTVRLQDNLSRRFDRPFSWFSEVGSFEVIGFMVLMLLMFLMFKRKFLAAGLAFFLFGLFHIIEIFGKSIVDNIPPPEFLLRTERLIEFPQFHVRSEFSYPSGHSGRTAFLSVVLLILVWRSHKLPRLLKLLMMGGILLFDFLMFISRVYLGEHWLTDVVGGAVLGAAFGMIVGGFIGKVSKVSEVSPLRQGYKGQAKVSKAKRTTINT